MERMKAQAKRKSNAVVIDSRGDFNVLVVYGELDMNDAKRFEADIVAAVGQCKTLAIDFSECRYIDSSIIGVLGRAHRAFGEYLKIVVAPKGSVNRILTLTGMDRELNVVRSLDELDVA
jgi:anti-anti-sigma factor